MRENGSLTGILISDAIAADNKAVWILPLEKCLILKIEKNSGRIHPCGIVPNPNGFLIPYRFMFLYENKLYLLPYDESKITIFDIDKESFQHIDVDINISGGKKHCRFTSYVLVGNKAIITGEFSKVLFFNLKTNEMKWIELKDAIPKEVNIDYWVWRYSYMNDCKLYLVPLMSPYIFIIDIESAKVKCQKITDDNCKYFDNPVIVEDRLYYFDRNERGMLSEYNIITNELKKHETGICTSDLRLRANGYVVFSNNALWCFPGITDKGEVYRFSKNEIEEINSIPTIRPNELGRDYPYEFNYRNGILTNDGHILLVHAWTEQLIDVDTSTGNVSVTKIVDSVDADWNAIYNDEFCNPNNRIIREWKGDMLEALFDHIVSNK